MLIRALIVLQIQSADNQNIDPQNDPKLLLIHPVGVDTMQNHNPHDQKTDPQNDPKIVANPP